MRVLIVDKDEALRQLLRRILADTCHEVLLLADGGEAMALMIGGEMFDAVISEVHTGKTSGIDLFHRIRAIGQSASMTTLVLMSGDTVLQGGPTRLEDVCAELQAEFLLRPFTPDQLLDAIAVKL